MAESPQQPPPAPQQQPQYPPAYDPVGEPMLLTIISAVVFLYFGFYRSYTPTADAAPFYALSVHGFTWMARTVGIGLLIVAGLTFARLPASEWVNLIVSVIAAFGCLAIATTWLLYNDGDWILIMLFGLLNLGAVRGAWLAVKRTHR
ncbi:MAG: hypothetical protein ACKVS9_11360 [Phycisphaerae bacterium]